MLKDGTVENVQEGVFRTNCIDCLDRTNVVQSLLGRSVLQDQLKVGSDRSVVLAGFWFVSITRVTLGNSDNGDCECDLK